MSQEMYCRRCGYNLAGATPRGCPECGHFFDPNDPRSILTRPSNRLPFEVWCVVAMQGLVVLLLLAGIIAALFDRSIDDSLAFVAILIAIFIGAPVQFAAMFYGLCVAIFQCRNMSAATRCWFFLLALLPWYTPLLGYLLLEVAVDYLF